MADSDRNGWRNIDVVALLAWVALLILAVVDSGTGRSALAPWCGAVGAAASAMSAVAYCCRRFDRLERDAFERGLRVGMGAGGVSKLDEHERRY